MAPNLNRITSQLRAAEELLASQGTVVATWRKRRNSLTGPYYRVRYFENGIRRSIYLGRDEYLADAIRRYLADLQHPRIFRRLRRQIRRSLRLEKRRLEEILNIHGYYMKGFEIRKQNAKACKKPCGTRISPTTEPPCGAGVSPVKESPCVTVVSSVKKRPCGTGVSPVKEKHCGTGISPVKENPAQYGRAALCRRKHSYRYRAPSLVKTDIRPQKRNRPNFRANTNGTGYPLGAFSPMNLGAMNIAAISDRTMALSKLSTTAIQTRAPPMATM
jgi:hypothetical protein